MLILLASVVGLRGVGDNLDQQREIQKRVLFFIEDPVRPANHRGIGVGYEAGSFYFDAEVTVINEATCVLEPVGDLASQVCRDQAMGGGPTDHSKHLAIKKLTPDLRQTFQLQ